MGRIEKIKRKLIEESNKRMLGEQIFKNKIQLKLNDESDFRDIDDLSINYYGDGERFNFWDFMTGNYFSLKINGDDCIFRIRKEDGKEYNLIIKDKEKVDKSTVYKLTLPKELEVESGSANAWYGEMIINCKGKQTTMDWEMTD